MAAIAHSYVEQTTAQTRTGATTYADISGAAIADTEFVDGAKYLIVASALLTNDNANGNAGIQVVHGTTPFAESEFVVEPATLNVSTTYLWFTVWTAVAGEGIKLQHATVAAAGDTTTTQDATIFAMRLDADLTENTDWVFAENGTDTTLTTTPQTFASASITPGEASDWLVLAYGQGSPNDLTISQQYRLVRSGEASSSTPESIIEGEDAARDRFIHALGRVYALGAAANTFAVHGLLSGTGGASDLHLHSALFLLNLNKFRNHSFAFTAATLDLSATSFASQIESITLQPAVTSDVWTLGYWIYTKANLASAISAHNRVQIDASDQPPTQTTDNVAQGRTWDVRDEIAVAVQTVDNLDTTSHTIDMDGDVETAAAGRGARDRTFCAVTMELAAAAQNALLLRLQTEGLFVGSAH